MPNPLASIIHNINLPERARYALAWLAREAVGLAHDYWSDGVSAEGQVPSISLKTGTAQAKNANKNAAINNESEPTATDDGAWHALPGEISEKMWGESYVTPGDKDITEKLIMPLGINKDMSVIDLSAGLGGRLRKTSEEFGVYITGMEPDPDIAARGMELSRLAGLSRKVMITSYDPMNFVSNRTYDCMIARETIYRVADKNKFITSIAAACKRKAQISFTDYIVDAEFRDQPAILAWQAYETGASPCSLIEMAEMWARHGFTLRVHDDQTDYYKKEITRGMGRLAAFLASDIKPSPLTKKAINKRITTWAHRSAALQAGMKFYRFYGLR